MFARYGVGMFVKTTRRRRGDKTYEYLSLAESVRDGAKTRHRTLLRLADLTERFAAGRICVVADRGLISADNIAAVAEAGCDHVLVARTETELLALEERVRAGRLTDPAKIARAAQRIVGPSGTPTRHWDNARIG